MKAIGKLRKSKKAVSTVIGTIFFMIIFFSSFLTMLYVTSTTSQLEQQRVHENVVITSAYLDRNKRLALNVTNYGSVTSHLTRLWIINATDNNHNNFEFDYYLGPGEAISNITRVTLTSRKTYAIRIATELGNIVSYNLVPQLRARISLFANPTVQTATNMTIFMLVTNNDTSNNNIYNLVPTLTVSPTEAVVLKEGPTPPSVSLLPKGSTAFFRWVYEVTGAALKFTFNGTFVDAPQGVYATSVCSALLGPPIILAFGSGSDVLFGVPSPGDITEGKESYWGVIIGNPSDRNLIVYSVTITCTAARLHKANRVWGVYPSTGWASSNPTATSSIVEWKSITGVAVGARSAYNFTCRGELRDSIIEAPVFIEALTSEGKFVKVCMMTQASTYPCMNLYYTKEPTSPTNNWGYVIAGVPKSSSKTFNVTLYNSGSNALSSNASLNILTPAGWRNVAAASGQAGGFWGTPVISSNIDGSSTIRVTSTATSFAAGAYKVFQFSATSPTVDKTALYKFPTISYYPAFPYFISAANCEAIVVVTP